MIGMMIARRPDMGKAEGAAFPHRSCRENHPASMRLLNSACRGACVRNRVDFSVGAGCIGT